MVHGPQNSSTQQSIVSRLLSEAQDIHDPMHTAAISYLASVEVHRDLLQHFRPQPERRQIGRNGTYRHMEYEGWEQNAAPQPQFVIETGDGGNAISMVDLVFPLTYKVQSRTTHGTAATPSSVDETLRHIPLLIQVRLNPPTIEPEILTFNTIRHFIQTRSEISNQLHTLFENECVLATKRALNGFEANMLVDANIFHIHLGSEFDTFWHERWLENQKGQG